MRISFLVFFVLTACGVSEDPPRASPPQSILRLAEAICERQTECLVPLVNQDPVGESCVDQYVRTSELAVQSGLIQEVPDNADACRRAVERASCGELAANGWVMAESCVHLFRGERGEGESCGTAVGVFLNECEPGLECQFDNQCPGTCQRAELDCSLTGCSDGEYCDIDQCVAQRRQGEPCSWEAECGEGLYCRFGEETPAVCTPRISQGSTCGWNDECETGLFCDTLDSQTCQPQVSEGQPCTASTGCSGKLACLSDNESASRRCLPPRSEGGYCEQAEDCEENLYCSFSDGRAPSMCRRRVAVGEPCESSFRVCVDGARCDFESMLCVDDEFAQETSPNEFTLEPPSTIVGAGESCDAEHRCELGYTCADGSCQEPAALGESCPGSLSDGLNFVSVDACAEGICDLRSEVCVPLAGPGESCPGRTPYSVDLACSTLYCGRDGNCADPDDSVCEL